VNLEIIENIILSNPLQKYKPFYLLKEYYKLEGFQIMQASAKAEANLERFIEIVQSNINFSIKENLACLYETISNAIVNVNLDYFKVKTIWNELQNLTWQNFEDFCAGLMRKSFGASSVNVTQRTADMGLDFSGIIPFKSAHSNVPFSNIEFFGQAKKYAGNVGRGDVDAFTAFANRQKRDNRYPAQLFIFCTTSDFIASAKSEISKNHFIAINGFQIATIVYNESEKEGMDAIKEFL